jgi:hypothetical protein
MLKFAVVILVLTAFAQPSYAVSSRLTGNELFDICKFGQEDSRGGLCAGYIMGVIDGMLNEIDDAKSMGSNIPPEFCIDVNATNEQTVDIVKKFLVDHPDFRHFSAASLVTLALMGPFPYPCR